MNREDEIFDDFLRSSFESKKFTNKPHYWHNAQEMIARERKNNSFRPIIAGSVTLVAALSFIFLLSSKSNSDHQSDATILTASSVNVGTSTTSTYNVNMPPVNAVTETAAGITENNTVNNRTIGQTNTVANNGIIDTPSPDDRKTRPVKRRKNKRHSNTTTETAQSVQTNQTIQVIDINGKTLITPLQTTAPAGSFSKTSAYIAYAAKAQKSFIALEAGINGYNPGSDILSSINGQIGIRYYRFVNSKIALSTGLTYARLHQHMPGRSFESTNYDFGKNASSVVITTQRLDYIELPVSVLYQLAPKHSLTAGISLGYVIQSADKVQDETGKQTMQKGYLTGINRWDTQLNLGYQYNLSQKIWIRTSYHMGLMDISDNAIFKNTTTDTNKGLRLTLGYKVF